MKIGGDDLFKLKIVITENTPTNLTAMKDAEELITCRHHYNNE